MGSLLKYCWNCKKELSLESFGKNRSKPDGLSTECKACKSEQDRLYRERNEQKCKERAHRYYLKHTDEAKARANEWFLNNRDKHREHGNKAKHRLKVEVFSHYCEGEPRCQWCGITEIGLLSIDHVNDDGAQHRQKIFGDKTKGGYPVYQWIKRNFYPDTFQVLCHNCQYRKRYASFEPETLRQRQKQEYARKVKIQCLENYGGLECSCGETDLVVLTLDHVNDDGAEHRRDTGARGYGFYIMLRKNGFPNDPPLQVKCLNCNVRKRNEKYERERKGRSSINSDG